MEIRGQHGRVLVRILFSVSHMVERKLWSLYSVQGHQSHAEISTSMNRQMKITVRSNKLTEIIFTKLWKLVFHFLLQNTLKNTYMFL